ncbi:hypothetical protein [Marinospirillum perlucidum]|uniref:hypothetical protein n=1 Tax=Marinospirillum perlucidum TaxID=1982602 RepID=UPI000DF25011|nr:hypothetical protein [Marinospirillum perlucidum]
MKPKTASKLARAEIFSLNMRQKRILQLKSCTQIKQKQKQSTNMVLLVNLGALIYIQGLKGYY